MISSEELKATVERLRMQGTDDELAEVKRCEHTLSSDVWETVSSFANTAGGLILFGLVEREGFKPAKAFEIDRVRDQFVSGIGDGGESAKVTNPPHYELSRGEVDGSQVLVVRIEELHMQQKPCFITARGVQNGSYKRVDDKDIRLSATELYEMQSVLIPSDADSDIVPDATVDDLDGEIVSAVIESRRRQSPRILRGAETRERQMERLNFTNKAGAIRLAGLLAAGLYPQQFYPKLVIDIATHPGIKKAEPGAARFIDRQICDGPLAPCIEEALLAIGRNLRTVSFISGAGRKDEWEIPEEVLREALANAVIHREYSPMFVGQSVSVDIYPDRVEIANPGGLWGGKTPDTLGDGESRCRNPRLMNLMGAVPLEHAEGHVAESQGSGIVSMMREMASRSLSAPQFKVKPDSFTVILARHGVEIAQNRSWLAAHTDELLGRREETALMLLRGSGEPLSVQQLRVQLGWDSDDIREACGHLVDSGLVCERDSDVYCALNEGGAQVSDGSSAMRERILACISAHDEISARGVADELGVAISRVRYHLPILIKAGDVVPTAASTSRKRMYRVARGE